MNNSNTLLRGIVIAFGISLVIIDAKVFEFDLFIYIALGTGILTGWFLYTLFRDVPNLHARRPVPTWIIIVGNGTYALICLAVAYIFATESDPSQWPLIAYNLGLLFLVLSLFTKQKWVSSSGEQDSSETEIRSKEEAS